MKTRIIYLDIIKILAILLVIFNHSHFYITNNTLFENGLHITLFDFCKIAVPLFIMVSGALLLGKETSYKDIFCKRIWRVLVPLIIVTAIFSLMHGDNIKDFVYYLFFGYNDNYNPYHLWYLYMLIGLYLVTPFLQKMIKNFKEIDFKWFITLFVIVVSIFNIIPLISLVFIDKPSFIKGDFTSLFFSIAIGYYITGYYLSKKEISKKTNIISIIILILSVLIGALFMFFLLNKGFEYDEIADYSYITTAIPAICTFIILKYYFNKTLKNKTLNKLITITSNSVFGVYLFHVFFLGIVYETDMMQFVFDFNQVLGIFCLDIIVLIFLTIIVWLLQKVPIIKKFL